MRPSSWFLGLRGGRAAIETRRRKSAMEMDFPLLSSFVETGFLIMPADLSSSASDRLFTAKPKAALNTENISSQTILRSIKELEKIIPVNSAEVELKAEGNRRFYRLFRETLGTP